MDVFIVGFLRIVDLDVSRRVCRSGHRVGVALRGLRVTSEILGLDFHLRNALCSFKHEHCELRSSSVLIKEYPEQDRSM